MTGLPGALPGTASPAQRTHVLFTFKVWQCGGRSHDYKGMASCHAFCARSGGVNLGRDSLPEANRQLPTPAAQSRPSAVRLPSSLHSTKDSVFCCTAIPTSTRLYLPTNNTRRLVDAQHSFEPTSDFFPNYSAFAFMKQNNGATTGELGEHSLEG